MRKRERKNERNENEKEERKNERNENKKKVKRKEKRNKKKGRNYLLNWKKIEFSNILSIVNE